MWPGDQSLCRRAPEVRADGQVLGRRPGNQDSPAQAEQHLCTVPRAPRHRARPSVAGYLTIGKPVGMGQRSPARSRPALWDQRLPEALHPSDRVLRRRPQGLTGPDVSSSRPRLAMHWWATCDWQHRFNSVDVSFRRMSLYTVVRHPRTHLRSGHAPARVARACRIQWALRSWDYPQDRNDVDCVRVHCGDRGVDAARLAGHVRVRPLPLPILVVPRQRCAAAADLHHPAWSASDRAQATPGSAFVTAIIWFDPGRHRSTLGVLLLRIAAQPP